MTTIDARDPIAILTHEVKLLSERIDWLEMQVRELLARDKRYIVAVGEWPRNESDK